MAKYIRYALATVCFAASVACVALWWRTETFVYTVQRPISGSSNGFQAAFYSGSAAIGIYPRGTIGLLATAPPR
ncbi:hypothetical protein I41_39610 [Lacipirellula limnantheis]|uniref:Uncharacterized protein n=1 Tax=Lacipirellula limnantheis TaxID=2528024 RepID=A0A517U2B0_9BACT|nr:hypothetical protein I41_39610 [Lacipirellula limnantheis]